MGLVDHQPAFEALLISTSRPDPARRHPSSTGLRNDQHAVETVARGQQDLMQRVGDRYAGTRGGWRRRSGADHYAIMIRESVEDQVLGPSAAAMVEIAVAGR